MRLKTTPSYKERSEILCLYMAMVVKEMLDSTYSNLGHMYKYLNLKISVIVFYILLAKGIRKLILCCFINYFSSSNMKSKPHETRFIVPYKLKGFQNPND